MIEETDEWELRLWDLGFKEKIPKHGHMGMSQWLEYGLKTPEDWPKFKVCLNPKSPIRFPENWEELVKIYETRDYPLGIGVGSFYGAIRNWMGMEGISLMYYDNPKFMHEIADYMANFSLELIKKATSYIKDFDFATFFEDMAYKTGPLVSPNIFREFMLPYYKRVTRFLRSKGIEIIMVDSDGNLDTLIPLFLEAGVNGVYPLEIAAGSYPEEYRELYKDRLVLMGGVDKRALSRDRQLIDQEIDRIKLIVGKGGYIPFVDHYVPPDVPFDNFCYYLDKLKKVLNIQCP